MKDKIILSDCDGVLLDWRKGFLEWLPDHISNTLASGAMEEENFNNAFDYDMQHIDNLAVEFNQSPAISRLEPCKDALEYVRRLGDLGFRFRVCTAMGMSELSQQYREYNLYTVFGDYFDEVSLRPVGGSKASWLEQYKDTGLFWLEDHVRHAQDGHNLGLQPIVVADSSNEHYKDLEFPRTSHETPWKDIYELILKDYNESN